MSQSTGTRRGRFRFLYQFSLRTLLLVTAGVAVFCNWYFQPKYHEEELAGKHLRVRQQRKLVRPQPVQRIEPWMSPGPPPEPQPVDHGHYTLLDGDDFVLARGQFADGSASGHWVTYYPTGRKAAQGKMQSGVKVGLWRTWYEDGTLSSEVTYADKPVERFDAFRPNRPFVITVWPVGVPSKVLDPHIDCYASREGPIKSWYANGRLRYEGQNVGDQQEGVWKYYDERGRLTASGPYRAGKRHGPWILTQGASEGHVGQASRLPSHSRSEWTTLTVEYIDGRTRDELNRLLARLEKQLESPQSYRRMQALIDLAEIGEGAAWSLQKRLAANDAGEQAAILAVVPRMNAAAAPLVPRIRELAEGSHLEVSHRARLALFQVDAASRNSLYDALVAEAIAAPRLTQCLHELVVLYRSDRTRQGDTFAALMSLPCTRANADSDHIISAVTQLGGDMGPHLAAALKSKDERVRLQAARTLLSLFASVFRPETFVSFDESTWNNVLAGLKSDPSPQVRALADEIGRGPRLYGFGSGGMSGGLF